MPGKLVVVVGKEVFVPCYMDLSIGLVECPHNITTSFPRASDERVNKMKVTMFFMS